MLKLMDTRFDAVDKALGLQAREYERRLSDLNHAHEKAVQVQHTYVTQDKYEDKLHSEALARELALNRIDEKFQDHVKRYELRQREIDELVNTAKGAAVEAARVATETARKTTRNIALTGLGLAVMIAVMNFLAASPASTIIP